MAKVVFTPHLNRFIETPPIAVKGATVHEVLGEVFAKNPRLRGYILDDQDRLRKHVVVFVDGQLVRDRTGLTDQVSAASEVYVMQALSGGEL